MAATPVGANTTIRLVDRSRRLRKKVVFPLPALPVRKTFTPVYSTNCHASSNSGLDSIGTSAVCGFLPVSSLPVSIRSLLLVVSKDT